MKNIGFTFLFIVLMATTAQAQVALEGGLNLANLAIKGGGTKMPTKFKTAGAFGFVVDIELADHVYFEPGLYYLMNGCIVTGPPTGEYAINTITIPLNIEYKSGEKCSSRFFAGVGPYIGRNISGSYFYDAYGTGTYQGESFVIGSDKSATLKALDLGFGLNVGYILKKHSYLRLRYQMGFVNLVPGGDADNSLKTSSFGVTMGYLFGGCRNRKGGNPFSIRQSNHWRGMSKGVFSRRSHPARYPQ